MADRSKEEASPLAGALRRGDERLAAGDLVHAHEAYVAAQRFDSNDPEVLSRLGLTLVLVARDEYKGVAFCEEAIRRGGETWDRLWRLARVYLATCQRERAFRSIRRGLALEPGSDPLRQLLVEMGIRRPPVLPFLSRSNILNKTLGRLRHRLTAPRYAREG